MRPGPLGWVGAPSSPPPFSCVLGLLAKLRDPPVLLIFSWAGLPAGQLPSAGAPAGREAPCSPTVAQTLAVLCPRPAGTHRVENMGVWVSPEA